MAVTNCPPVGSLVACHQCLVWGSGQGGGRHFSPDVSIAGTNTLELFFFSLSLSTNHQPTGRHSSKHTFICVLGKFICFLGFHCFDCSGAFLFHCRGEENSHGKCHLHGWGGIVYCFHWRCLWSAFALLCAVGQWVPTTLGQTGVEDFSVFVADFDILAQPVLSWCGWIRV